MVRNSLREWISPAGRVGRRGYWIHFMLPALALGVVGVILPVLSLTIRFMIPETVLSIIRVAAVWLFVAGNLKRVRDLRMSRGRAAGLVALWGSAMVIASVVAGGLLLFGLLAVMGNGGPDGEALMVYSVLVFLTPIVAGLFAIGFVPGGPDPEAVTSPAAPPGGPEVIP